MSKSIPTVPNDLHVPFHNTQDALGNVLLERNAEIHTAMLALIGRQHHFVLGAPGIAKSLLVEQLALRISGIRFFRYLFTRTSQPDEVLGGPNVKLLAETGIVDRVIDGMLPDCDIAFSDEIFKANAAILNAQLMIMNERLFNRGPEIVSVPLHTMFAASNELYDGDELKALWDRLHFRHFASPLQETSNFVQMLELQVPSNPAHTITLEQIHQAYQVSQAVEVPEDLLRALVKLKEDLLNENIEVSDRRWRESVRVIKSEAFFNGHMVAEIDDMRPLMHVLWNDPDQIKLVRRMVLELANPIEREASELLDSISEAYTQYEQALKDADNKQQRAAHGVDMYKKLTKAKDKYTALRKANKSTRQSDVMDELGTKLTTVGKSLLHALGHEDDEDTKEA